MDGWESPTSGSIPPGPVTHARGRTVVLPRAGGTHRFGPIALLTASLQGWPWLRRTYPAVPGWSGRAYLALGVLPGGVAVLAVAPFGVPGGLTGRVANTMLAVLWLGTALAGYRAARARQACPPRGARRGPATGARHLVRSGREVRRRLRGTRTG
ncbi:MAG TPA: hypothetical protein VFE39_02710 [Pseudonocardia sp.]|nr:hypothetical protein [Pseudonocardia sp.]